MPVPANRRGGRIYRLWQVALPGLLLLSAPGARGLPRGPQPAVRLNLADLGFPGVPQALLDAGASMLTAHFVDGTHLLVTYSLRGLVERIPDDPPNDDDRVVAALLVELPSGKVLARTRWHLHDHGQYIWSLGGGRFLLRTHSTLTAIAPVANLGSSEPFRQTPFVRLRGVIDAVLIAPEGDLVTVETSPPQKPRPGPSPINFVNDPPEQEMAPPETFYFVKVAGSGSKDSPVQAVAAGAVKTNGVGLLPMNGRGYLFAKDEKRDRWAIQFDSFDGEIRKLASVDSRCPPRMQFVSPSQYVVFTCGMPLEKITMQAFNFTAHETWEEPLSGGSPYASFAYAQPVGRFAISRTVSPGSVATGAGLGPSGPLRESLDPSTTQEVRVYQMESGDLLLKLACLPVSRTAQNFDLSPDGMSALIIRDGAIEVYTLPEPSKRDKQELAEVREHEPPVPHSNLVRLRMLMEKAAETEMDPEPALAEAESARPAAASAPAADSGSSSAAPGAVTATASASAPANAPANEGDVMQIRRKPPSLLNPGETSEDGKKPPKP